MLLRVLLAASLVLLGLSLAAAQGKDVPEGIRASSAYAEVLLRKTEILADLEAFSADYTETHPKILDLRFELASLDRSIDKILAVKATETGRLTDALGKLIVKRAALDAELNHLTRSYNKDHPEVKRAKRRLEIFEAAIDQILR